MTARHDHDPDHQSDHQSGPGRQAKTERQAQIDAQARVTEITTLFARIRGVLDHSLRIADDLAEDTPRILITRMDQLIAAHLKVLTAEEAFNAAQNANPGDIDQLDSIRDDLGRRLDRLRASLGATGVSGQPE
ncbi:hypothetical protein [Yoonia vestfoldensis]|jgi:hypothetical protein|uniref:hypothetical protein n=1 Tax=Yoonia vestfoldensis TaxID=245188 RepID=UPI001F3E1514|nr:hypothetical protein [Yoonia vestfoldensis]